MIAAETGWPLDRVQRYAGPPLAERAYIAQRAQQVELRRSPGPVLLWDAIELVIGSDDASSTQWDAFRRDDGKWIVTVDLPSGSRHRTAAWTYDPAGPNVHPIDEAARWLMGVSDEPIIDYITETTVAVVHEAPEIEPVAEPDSRPHLVAVPAIDDDEDEDVVLEEPIEEPSTAERDDALPTGVHESSHGGVQTTISIQVDEPANEPIAAPTPKPKPAAKPKAKGRRASVPSWDEILFGATRGEDS